jgi:gallate dioxygenase
VSSSISISDRETRPLASIIGGIGTSHVPTIGVAYDRGRQNDPAWSPLFEGYKPVAAWLKDKRPDVLVIFYNDHATQFFFDLYPTFAIGIAHRYAIADEGAGRRPLPAIPGHPGLSAHILESLLAEEFDMTVFQGGEVDHGCHSALPLLWPHVPGWPGAIVPIAINVVHYPLPTARRCFRLGQAVRRAIASFSDDIKVAVVGTGGLSHQVHGERTGFNNTPWDTNFLQLIVEDPGELTKLTHADYIRRGGAESVEMIMWLAMRGAIGERIRSVHENYYLATTTAMAVALYEPTSSASDHLPEPPVAPPKQTAGLDDLEGTYIFDALTSFDALELNRFLWNLTKPDARLLFVDNPDNAFERAGLAADDRQLIRDRDWIGLIRRGANFFALEKLARVSKMSNLEVYASMRGEDLETFMRTRQVPDAR